MAQASAGWEKTSAQAETVARLQKRGGRMKFMVAGLVVLSAAVYLMVSGTMTGARYFITVEDLVTDTSYVGETVRISGAVIGETIVYDTSDPNMPVIEFTISHIPTEFDDLATALHNSVTDPTAARLPVRVENEPMPDLLQHEAQAILTGYLDDNGIFQANELLLKCPSRFEEDGPGQEIAGEV